MSFVSGTNVHFHYPAFCYKSFFSSHLILLRSMRPVWHHSSSMLSAVVALAPREKASCAFCSTAFMSILQPYKKLRTRMPPKCDWLKEFPKVTVVAIRGVYRLSSSTGVCWNDLYGRIGHLRFYFCHHEPSCLILATMADRNVIINTWNM